MKKIIASLSLVLIIFLIGLFSCQNDKISNIVTLSRLESSYIEYFSNKIAYYPESQIRILKLQAYLTGLSNLTQDSYVLLNTINMYTFYDSLNVHKFKYETWIKTGQDSLLIQTGLIGRGNRISTNEGSYTIFAESNKSQIIFKRNYSKYWSILENKWIENFSIAIFPIEFLAFDSESARFGDTTYIIDNLQNKSVILLK